MQKQFLKYCKKTGLRDKAKILIAVSGGLDSMALLYLFRQSGFSVQAAHCNFNLRGEESDGDEQFVKETCDALDIPIHIKHFDTETHARSRGVSIQMAARDLRYAWFEEVRAANDLDHIATAHHQDDQIETILLNLSRGTGLKGMHGILAVQNKLIRPLLFTDRSALETWMSANNFSYREDSSNASLKYSRNKLRHQVIPILKEINPSLSNTFQENVERFGGGEQNLSFLYEKQRQFIVLQKGDEQHIVLSELLKYPSPMDVLFHFINVFGFNDWKAIENLMNSESGKIISSETHELLKDRRVFILREKQNEFNHSFHIAKEQESVSDPICLSFQMVDGKKFELNTSEHIAALDFDKLQFPLELRKWQKGDVFQPLGMRGKKKLSDFFIDQKMSLFEKENTWLLCSSGQIVWVVGYRIDERFKLVEASQKVYLVRLNEV
jgi:tRNA(Ile)-lysidine synthase